MREEIFHKWYREWRTIVKFAAKIHPSAHDKSIMMHLSAGKMQMFPEVVRVQKRDDAA